MNNNNNSNKKKKKKTLTRRRVRVLAKLQVVAYNFSKTLHPSTGILYTSRKCTTSTQSPCK